MKTSKVNFRSLAARRRFARSALYTLLVMLMAASLCLGSLLPSAPAAAQGEPPETPPSGRGQVSLAGPMGVVVNTYNGSLSYTRSDLAIRSNCEGCCYNPSLRVSLTYNSQDASLTGAAIGYYRIAL